MENAIAQIPNESNEVKVTVTLVLNASFSWLERPTKSVITYHLFICIVLASLAITAVAINACLLVSIFCSSSLKRVILNQLVSVVSAACVLDCSINIPFSLYYIRNGNWTLGVKVCTVNAVSIILISLIITWSVCAMCLERWFSIFRRKSKLSTVCKHAVTIATPITLSLAILFPVVQGLIEVRLFPSRFMCSIAIRKEQCYRTVILLSFVLPVAFGLLALLTSSVKNFTNIRRIGSQRGELSYAELFFEESHLWNEWQSSKFVGIITLLFLVLQFPFIIRQTDYASEFGKSYEPNLNQQQNSSAAGNIFLPLTHMTSPIDKAYFWSKFLFCLLFPVVALVLRKDIRRKLNSMISLCRPNSCIPNKTDSHAAAVQDESPEDFLVPQMWRRRRLSSVTCLTTPIVFGKNKVANSEFQLLDLSSGIAKWKASYDESRKREKPSQKHGKTFFDDAFEDEEEFTEFVRYEDGTEDEINSSEDFKETMTVKEVAVQTSEKCFLNKMLPEEFHRNYSQASISLNSSLERRNSFEKRKYRNRNRRLSKSFTSNRNNNISLSHRNYMTYPKISSNARMQPNIQANLTTSDLIRALKIYRSRKSLAACDIIPRGTAELMDSPSENKDIVSL